MKEDITLFPEKARIGIAILARNDENTIPSVVLLCRGYSRNILVVDDGSRDETAFLARKAGAKVASFQNEIGKGFALKEAFSWARKEKFDVLVTIDGNGQYDPSVIPFLAEPVIKDRFDIVIGSKGFTHEGKSRKTFSWRLGNWMTRSIRKAKVNKPIYDRKSGYRAYHKKTFNKFDFADAGIEQEELMLVQADERKFRVEEVPMKAIYGQLTPDDIGLTNWLMAKLSLWMNRLRINSPLRISMILGSLLLLGAVASGIYARINYPNHEFLAPGGLLVVLSLLLLAAFVILNGIIFEAIRHIGGNMVSYMQKNDQIKLEYDPLKGFQR
ncbi:MAG: glycosyltransferase family 2 protein [Thermoplasmatota archaeon]